MFLSCIVVIKTRSALSWYQTYSTALQFAKVTSAYLFFRMNVYVGLFYWEAFFIINFFDKIVEFCYKKRLKSFVFDSCLLSA